MAPGHYDEDTLVLQRKVGNKSRKARQFGLAVGQVSDVVAFLVVSHHA